MHADDVQSSVAIEVSNPSLRGIDFDPLKDGYLEAARGLIDGGAVRDNLSFEVVPIAPL